VTREWWESRTGRFEFVASELVVQEAGEGDQVAAQDRLRALNSLPLIEVSERALMLAQELVETGAIPHKAAEDALHIAIAATNGIEYLVTWNYRHLANATMRQQIGDVCRASGFEPPIICSPEELMEDKNDGE
jgi:hypothetical protein